MFLIVITAKGRFIPKDGDNSGYEPLPIQIDGNTIFKKQCDEFLVYVTKCIADESQSQLYKHNYIASILDVVEEDAGPIDIAMKYLIAHDGDLLEYIGGKYGKNGLFHKDEFCPADTESGANRLFGRFLDNHIFVFQHEPIYTMFSEVICKIKRDFSKKQILTALSIIRNET